jgi:hypothetical protein
LKSCFAKLPGFISIVISALLVTLNLSSIKDITDDINEIESKDGVPPPKYILVISLSYTVNLDRTSL